MMLMKMSVFPSMMKASFFSLPELNVGETAERTSFHF